MEILILNILSICIRLHYIYGKTIGERIIEKRMFFVFSRQRMKEEKLIHPTYSAYFNDENNNKNFYSIFHNCFHSYEILQWFINKQLCKTLEDGREIFRVLEKFKIIHHGKCLSLAQCQFTHASVERKGREIV